MNKETKKINDKDCHLSITLDEKKHLLILEPKAELTKDDFIYLASIVDPYFAKGNTIKGLMIKTKNFPGWDSLAAAKEHLTFIKKHHKNIEKLAFVTDSSFIAVIKTITGAFVHPTIKEFKYSEADDAEQWVLS